MDFQNDIKKTPAEKSTDWYQTVAIVIGVVVAVLGLLKDLGSSVSYILLVFFATLLYPKTKNLTLTLGSRRKKRKAVMSFSDELGALVANLAKFIQSNTDYSIPYFLRTSQSIRPSDFIENLFACLINRLDERCNRGISSFREFDDISNDLYDCLFHFTRIYVEEIGAKLKQAENKEGLTLEQKSELNDKFLLFKQFLQSYNSYREKLSSYLKVSVSNQINIPKTHLV